jgi:hypothetical protein
MNPVDAGAPRQRPACRIRPFSIDEYVKVSDNPANSAAALHPSSETEPMKYLMLIKHSESYRTDPIPQALMDAMGEFVTESFNSGILKDTAGLRPTADGFRVRLRGGKLGVTDGPFTETKEVIGGYAIVDVASREEALKVARQFMELHRVHWPSFEGESEVRPLEDM